MEATLHIIVLAIIAIVPERLGLKTDELIIGYTIGHLLIRVLEMIVKKTVKY